MKNQFLNFYFKTKAVWNSLFIAVSLYSIILINFSIQGISPLLIIRDLAQTCEEKLGVGFISNLGIIIWISISSILIFVFKSYCSKRSKYRKLIFSGSILSTILALDDFFLIHDKFIIQEIIFLIYLLFAIYLVKKCFKQISLIDPYLFFASYICFGSSIFIDIVLQDIFPDYLLTSQILEEAFKFSGIICWFSFWWRAANEVVKENLRSQG